MTLRDPAATAPDADSTSHEAEDPRLRCRACATPLAHPHDALPNDAPVFVNPAGFLHELVAVSRAENVVAAGAPTLEFTWFPGYTWRLLYCAVCLAHVGWRYDAADLVPPTFVGLRAAALR